MDQFEIEVILQKMDELAAYLFSIGKLGAGNAILTAVELVDMELEDFEPPTGEL